MLVRDRSGLEVFMLRRNLRSVFVAGAYVFPGGAVDALDADPATLAFVDGSDADVADARLGTDGAIRFAVAAIRESFEEAGVLLARDEQTGRSVVVTADVASEIDADRRRVIGGTRSLADVARSRGLTLDAGALVPVARWITPPGGPRRYDTWFFVAPAPEGHAYDHDNDETIASVWVRPEEALARARARELELIYPTFRSLQMLAGFESTTDLLDAVRATWRDRPVPLRTENPGQGWMLDVGGDGSTADALEHSTVSHGRRGA